jgi:transcriptional regulator with XRE-family HTH domain
MSESLKLAILRSGMHQYVLAAVAHISETRLSRIVRGRTTATADEQGRLAAALGVPVGEIFPEGRG